VKVAFILSMLLCN